MKESLLLNVAKAGEHLRAVKQRREGATCEPVFPALMFTSLLSPEWNR